MINASFWKGKRVFLTGHTGFKGSWLSLWLSQMGAKVTGYALAPSTTPNMYELTRLDELVESYIADINDKEKLKNAVYDANPEIVIHMAAQPLVGTSYKDPVSTFQTNVQGTVNLLEAVRNAIQKGRKIQAVVNVTTDKCYENKEWLWGYREFDPLGGKDPYSASKACSEIVTAAYRHSFFHPNQINDHGVVLASARAGNVIGGGDWSHDRLIPQCLEAIVNQNEIKLRRPNAVRPWQHVLEPLSGYLLLIQKIYEGKETYADAWNFGPEYNDCRSVGEVVNQLIKMCGSDIKIESFTDTPYQESDLLMLDCSKAKSILGWQPLWNLKNALQYIVEWHMAYQNDENMRAITVGQINQYMSGLAVSDVQNE